MSYIHINISAPEKESFRLLSSIRKLIPHDNWYMRQHAWGNDELGILFNTDLLLPASDTSLITQVMTKIPSQCTAGRTTYKCNTSKLFQSMDDVSLPKIRKTFQPEQSI